MKTTQQIRSIVHLIVGIAAFLIIQIISAVAYLVPLELPAYILNMALQVGLLSLFITLYCKRVLHVDISDCRIRKPVIVPIWIVVAILLPLLVSAFFLLFTPGSLHINDLLVEQRISRIVRSVFLTGITAGVTEEMLFRGLIMRTLEKSWGRAVSIVLPSIIFASLHIMGIEQPNVVDILVLMIAGTAVGIMFSVITYHADSIWPSAIIHGIWNFIIIGGILRIDAMPYETDIVTYTLTSQNTLLTGGAFGIESSLPAIVGYCVVIILAIMLSKSDKHIYIS